MLIQRAASERKAPTWLTRIAFAGAFSLLAACVPLGDQKNNGGGGGDDCNPAGHHDHGEHKGWDKDHQGKGHDHHDKDGDGDDDHKGKGHHKDGHGHHHHGNPNCNVSTGTSTSTSTSTGTDTSTGYNFPVIPGRSCHVDRFRQAPSEQTIKKVDILFMMDHSGSMSDDWARVANNIQELVKELPADADIRYAVVLGDVGYWRGKLYAPSRIPTVLNNQTMRLQQISENLHKIFTEGMKVTDQGTGEALFASLQSAVTERAAENQKAGFFRPDAALSVIFMSDEQEIGFPFPSHAVLAAQGLPVRCDEATEDKLKFQYYDQKGINSDTAFNALKTLKGDMPVRTHAFVNITKEDLFKRNNPHARCLYDSLGYGYFEMVNKTKGLLYSIQADRVEGLVKCGQVIRESMQYQHDFKLSQPAEKVDPATILAAVDLSVVDHTYDAGTDTVHINNSGAANSLVEIGYCEPAAEKPPVWSLGAFSGTAGQTSVTLQWTTPGYGTGGRVLWGASPDALGNAVDDANLTPNHSVTVTGLAPNTVYYFQAVSWDGFGQIQESQVLSLRTEPAWTMSALVTQPSATSVSLQWGTPEYATKGYVLWGTSPDALGIQVNDAAVATAHEVVVSGLAPSTTYYFQAVSSDEFGQVIRSPITAVATLLDWGITSFTGNAGLSSVTITWATPEEATSGQVLWGSSAGSLANVVPEGAPTTSHSVVVNGLSPDTDYYFQAVSTDSLGLQKSTGVILLHTLTDWSLTNFSGVPTTSTVALSWNTSSVNTGGRVLWGTSATALTNVANDSAVGINHHVNVAGLTPNTVYYFQAVSNDSQGLERSSAVMAISTLSDLPNWSLQAFTGISTSTSVTLTWKTPEYLTNGRVVWGSSQTDLNNSVDEAGALNNHSVVVSGLVPNTIYYFQAIATDDHGQEQRSVVIPVSTLIDDGGVPPQNWTVQGFDGTTTATTASIIWQTPGVATKATLLVGTDPGSLTLQQIDVPAFSTSQLVEVTGLSPSTTYYFQVIAVDQSGRTVDSVILTKTTKAQ